MDADRVRELLESLQSGTVGIDAAGSGGSVEATHAAILNAQRVVGVAEM